MLGNLRRYDAKLVPWDTVDTSKRFATRRGEEGLKRELVALRGDKPERLMRVVVWQPSPLAATPVPRDTAGTSMRSATRFGEDDLKRCLLRIA